MKFKNFILSVRVMKYVKDNPLCTAPKIRNEFGIYHSKPPLREEKDLYRVISYLNDFGFIIKRNHRPISSGGAHFSLRTTQKGEHLLSSFRNIFQDILQDYSALERIQSKTEKVKPDDLSLDFSKFSKNVLEKLLQDILSELPQKPNEYLKTDKIDRLKQLIDYSHSRLQSKVTNIIDRMK